MSEFKVSAHRLEIESGREKKSLFLREFKKFTFLHNVENDIHIYYIIVLHTIIKGNSFFVLH